MEGKYKTTNGLELRLKAREIAKEAHAEQVRKSDGSPYIEHPKAVASILEKYGFSDEVIAAGLVHDVLEDSDISEAELRAELGDDVVDIVVAVSEDQSLEWEDRKQQYIENVAEGSDEVKAVSVADKIHNAQSFLEAYEEQGSELWRKFNRGREKTIWFQRELCNRLKEVWEHPMLEEYEMLVKKLEILD